MEYTSRFYLFLRYKGFIITLLSTIILSGCKTFDPRPYNESLDKVRTINEQSENYQNHWHDALIKHLKSLHDQYIEILNAKLKQEVFDKLIKNNKSRNYEPISIDDQDIFFPIQGNRTRARELYKIDIQKIISNHSFDIKVAGSTTSKDLIDIYIAKKNNNNIYNNLSPAQKELFESGISKLRDKIVDIPLKHQQQQDFDRLINVIEDHKKFNIKLASQHSQFEQELINALQAAASALKSNVWLAKTGNMAIGKINTLVESALSVSQQDKEVSNGSK